MSETRYYLEMNSADKLRPAREPQEEAVEVKREEKPNPQLSRSLYKSVGEGWSWVDRLGWSDDTWTDYLSQLEIETWILWAKGEPAGYFELRFAPDKSAEIVYFGLRREFIGRGLGGHLLTEAVQCAFKAGANRVWLHTSSRDHAQALANYKARGFLIFKTEQL